MTFLLRMKTWLLGLLLLLPFAFQMIVIADVTRVFTTPEGPGQDKILFESMIFFGVFAVVCLLSLVTFFCWMYSVGTGLYRKLPPNHNLKPGRFKFAFFFPFVYLAGAAYVGIFLPASELATLIFLIVPLHLFAMLCLFYVLRYLAKSLKSVELQRKVRFSDYAGEFFLFWFYFIGVWVLQPRINKIFANEERSESGGPVDRYLK